jgi:nitrate reductase delta subunit
MFKKTPETMRLTLRALARLLAYPGAGLRAQMPALIDALQTEQALPAARIAELQALAQQICAMDAYEAEGRYVDTFDRGHRTSLDLTQTYECAGLYLDAQELPDHLGVVLEFASTQPTAVAREFLAEMAHILNALFSALQAKASPYASVLAAVLEAAGETAQAVAIAPEPDMDEAWAEPEAFDGCATRGQNRPDQPQPIHIVRKARPQSSQGVSP